MSTRKTVREQEKRRKPTAPRLPRRQWTLPAGYHAEGGGVATLREVLSSDVPTIDGDKLDPDMRVALTLLRIEAQPDLRLVTSGDVLDKARALEEVRRGTPLGRILVAVEQRTIQFLREAAEAQRRARAKRQRERAKESAKTGKKAKAGKTAKAAKTAAPVKAPPRKASGRAAAKARSGRPLPRKRQKTRRSRD